MIREVGRRMTEADATSLLRKCIEGLHVAPGSHVYFRDEFLRRKGWSSIVASEAMSMEDAARVAKACEARGFGEAAALDLREGGSDKNFAFPLTSANLAALTVVYREPSFLVVGDAETFMIASDADYYWIVAGPGDFVAACHERGLRDVAKEFAADAARYATGTSEIRSALMLIDRENNRLPPSRRLIRAPGDPNRTRIANVPFDEAEWIILTDLYLEHRRRSGGWGDLARSARSELLALARSKGMTLGASFRTESGLKRQIDILRRLDGSKRLETRHSGLAETIWTRHSGDPEQFRRSAEAIRDAMRTRTG